MNVLRKEKIHTIKDILNLPDDERAELLDGQIYYMAPPSRIHQELVSELHLSIGNYIRKNSGKCKVYVAPDWIIEIVSPSSRQMDYYKKLLKYHNSGVKEYWVVDPQRQAVTVYNFLEDSMQEYTFSDTLKAGIYDDLFINFSDFQLN